MLLKYNIINDSKVVSDDAPLLLRLFLMKLGSDVREPSWVDSLQVYYKATLSPALPS